MSENEKLVGRLRESTQAMACFASAPMPLWNDHSNAVLEAATALTAAQARIRELEGALAARSAEPVAWRWRYDGERAWTLCKRKPALWPDAEMQPLYAHPKEAPDV